MLADLLRRGLRRALPFAVIAAAASPACLGAQERAIVSKRITLGSDEAGLLLELESGTRLDVVLERGVVRVDGDEAGEASEAFADAWGDLLGRLVSLEDDELEGELRSWSPPRGAGAAGERVRDAIRSALGLGGEAVEVEDTRDARLDVAIRELLRRPDRLDLLGELAEGVRLSDIRIHVGEDVSIEEGSRVASSLVMVDGDLDLFGEIDGDLLMTGGELHLHRGGLVTGDARLADVTVTYDGGEIRGETTRLDRGSADEARDTRAGLRDEDLDRIREELRREIASEARRTVSENVGRRRDGSSELWSPLRYAARGVSGIVSNVLTVLVLGLLGALFLMFGGSRLAVVAETARRSPGRSALVGLAGAILTGPVYVLGILALVVTIVGIPVILAWVPAYPVLVALAAGLGYYAVAHNVGGWIARRDLPYLGWVRPSSPPTLVAGGLLVLMAAFVLSNVAEIGGPWLGFLEGLFLTLGILGTVAATLIGFGAVLITRGGRRPPFYTSDDPLGSWFDETDAGGDPLV